jgi:transposase
MEFERTSVAQLTEIQRLIQAGQTNRQIARSLRCRRTLVAQVRAGQLTHDVLSRGKTTEARLPPGWALHVDWASVEKDIRDGHQLKRIWEEVAADRTSHSNFFKYVKLRFARLLTATVTLREFRAGEYCEVDYAGDTIEWLDRRSGEIRRAHVFVGILCFSQKIFAVAHEDEKKPNWLDAHVKMFEAYGGVPGVLVPDCLKNGVVKAHLYDPDLNPAYVELVAHYRTAVVPARVKRPRDKALVENAVGILMRYFRFVYRRRTFTSLSEVNEALAAAVAKINGKPHTRFKISRDERFVSLEKAALRALPAEPYAIGEWKSALHHPDCTVHVDKNFYSAPHAYRGKELRVKVSANLVEIFWELQRIAVHARARGKIGERIIEPTHLPENSRAYRETTPQMVLAQAKFSHPALHALIDELFNQDTLSNLRRAQGLVRKAYAAIQADTRERASPWIEASCAQMTRFGRVRVQLFEQLLAAEKKKSAVFREDREIQRQPGNPMVRGHGTRKPEGITHVPTPTHRDDAWGTQLSLV